ncbi:MAG: ThuA domain-containing protein [Phycisphaerales bacterium]|jgi:type 1 glutamine amidotransferase|nr:ThuA domain-containing protein [Phycisphaerales bacterium]
MIGAVLLAAVIIAAPDPCVQVFSKTAGFRHASIEVGVEAMQALGEDRWRLSATEDADVLMRRLGGTDVVVFLNTSGDVLDDDQQAEFERWLRRGGGFLGIHAAADTEYAWPFYGELLGGAWFARHPAIQKALIRIEDSTHPAVSHAPTEWTRVDEWYDFVNSPRGRVHVIAAVDESTYAGGSMGDDHPIVWTTPVGRGAAFYTGFGHTEACWGEPAFLAHIASAVDWAARDGWLTLSGGLEPWAHAAGWRPRGAAAVGASGMASTPGTGVLINDAGPAAGDLVTAASFGDCALHLEFLIPPGGNSGVYLQGRYEIQILDSHGVSSPTPGDCGGVYERWDETRDPKGFEGTPPKVNASSPAGAWQSYDIVFRAPRFGKDGRKIEDARIVRLLHNGIPVQEGVSLTGPTRGGGIGEAPTGPLRLQGDHGPVAYRNVRIRRLALE